MTSVTGQVTGWYPRSQDHANWVLLKAHHSWFNDAMTAIRDQLVGGLIVALFAIAAIVLLVQTGTRKAPTPNWMGPAVGLITINGPIAAANGNPAFGLEGSDAVLNELDLLTQDPRIKALVVRINSPGGTVGASQELYDALMRVKAKHHWPIVVSISDMGASGAYWVAMAGDQIVANPGSMVGSIGVIMQTWDFTQVPQRYGINQTTYKSGRYKDMLSSWRPPSAEEKKVVDSMLTDLHDQFRSVLIDRRRIPTADAMLLAQGQVFSGRQALDLKLVDHLGGMDVAIQLATQAANIPASSPLVSKTQPSFGAFLTQFLHLSSQLNPFSSTGLAPVR